MAKAFHKYAGSFEFCFVILDTSRRLMQSGCTPGEVIATDKPAQQ